MIDIQTQNAIVNSLSGTSNSAYLIPSGIGYTISLLLVLFSFAIIYEFIIKVKERDITKIIISLMPVYCFIASINYILNHLY